MSALRGALWAVRDTVLLTRRNLLHYLRVPQLIVYTVIQPIMFTLLFAFVFGGAIDTQNGDYTDFLIPGIIVQTVVFGAMGTGMKIAEDMQKGIMDRFRSLPIARGTVLAARIATDSIWNGLAILIMAGVGFAIGYQYHGPWWTILPAFGVGVLIAVAFSTIAATLGLVVKNVQSAEIVGFTWVFPLVFASSVFVEVRTMPGWLRAFASNTPITHGADAVRAYSLDLPMGDSLWLTLVWCAGIIAVFGPLAVWRFRSLA